MVKKDPILSRHKRDSTHDCVIKNETIEILKSNTNQHVFEDDPNQSLSLTWSGTNGVILVLSVEVGAFITQYSRLYRSTDRGKTFENISDKLSGGFIRKNSGMVTSPYNSEKVILFGIYDILGTTPLNIFVSKNSGATFTKVHLSFICNVNSLTFSPKDDNRLLMKSSTNDLYISLDFGLTWNLVNEFVATAHWDPRDHHVYYYTMDPTKELQEGSMKNELYRANASSGESIVIARDVHSFVVQENFLIASIQFCGKNGSRILYVSKSQGNAWNSAQVPMVGKDEFYSLLDMSEDMIFLHVDVPGDTGHGDIYTSDERGIVYSKSLKKHLYPNEKSIHDFYKVKSLPGTYITSQLSDDNTVHSLITFDKGGEWKPIPSPAGLSCPTTETSCDLQIHQMFSASKHISLPSYPLSSNQSVGIIIAHGNIGDGLNMKPPDVYVSRDGGYSWKQPPSLVGPHHYGIGDSGGLLYAVPASSENTNTIWFSLDEGACWFSYKFTDDEISVTGILSEPGQKAADITIWGYHNKKTGNPWVAFFINFESIMKNACTNNDYEKWSAHGDGCVLGSRVSYLRRKKDSFCKNGDQIDVTASHQFCECTSADYMCDFGYVRNKEMECVEEENRSNMDICINNEEELIVSQGYRKIPGDKCSGGKTFSRKPHLIHKKCSLFNMSGENPVQFESCFLPSSDITIKKQITQTSSGLTVFLALLVVVLVIAVAVLVYYKRYSLLRVRYRRLDHSESVENPAPKPNQLTGTSTLVDFDDEQLFTSVITPSQDVGVDLGNSTAVLSYHDDSDEDLLMT